MKYITGIHALNLNCNLRTCGDWHTSSVSWEHPMIAESAESIFGDYGIELNRDVPYIDINRKFNVANHIRALLDLIEHGDFSNAQGMNRDFICNSDYDREIFDKIALLKEKKNFTAINDFMCKEYRTKWLKYRGELSA
jgi:hypothetical protein